MPDLVVNDFNFAVYPPASTNGTLYICLNQDPLGNKSANNFLRVDNDGKATALAFEVEIGIVGVSDGESHAITYRLKPSGSLPAGWYVTWPATNSSFCLPMDTKLVSSPAYYKAYVLVAPLNTVAESDEENNYMVKPTAFLIP